MFIYNDGNYDCGVYEKGILHGLGRLNLHNNDIYDGFLKYGQFNGKGIFY
jgi:hypothetical protein